MLRFPIVVVPFLQCGPVPRPWGREGLGETKGLGGGVVKRLSVQRASASSMHCDQSKQGPALLGTGHTEPGSNREEGVCVDGI